MMRPANIIPAPKRAGVSPRTQIITIAALAALAWAGFIALGCWALWCVGKLVEAVL